MKWWFATIVLLASCGVGEHPDFLIGRQCIETNPMPCDEGQKCLPHSKSRTRFDDFRCRDARSILNFPNGEAPLAFCDDEKYICPDPLVCRPDRIRLDGGPRPNVCKDPNDVFTPPAPDAGGGA